MTTKTNTHKIELQSNNKILVWDCDNLLESKLKKLWKKFSNQSKIEKCNWNKKRVKKIQSKEKKKKDGV